MKTLSQLNHEMPKPDPVRAIALLSGGLDSRLAMRLLQAQNIEVHAVVFKSVFFNSLIAEQAASAMNIPIITEKFTDDILAVLRNPKHGFGSQMNPCIDCHTAMIHRAGEIMERDGFHLICTGEVLDQRPMSQNKKALGVVATGSGYGDYLLRPLSAKLLPPTIPELRGWVEREKLMDLRGRGRKEQMMLAEKWKITNYPQPAGGCLLTDPQYSRRLKELASHEGLTDVNRVKSLKIGRHFRLGEIKAIVGRNKTENQILESDFTNNNLLLKNEVIPGPTAVLPEKADDREIILTAEICARYAAPESDKPVEIAIYSGAGRRTLSVMPMKNDLLESYRIT